MKVLVTGHAGFIGFHVAQKLLARGDDVVGFDCLNDYYDVSIKRARLDMLEKQADDVTGSLTHVEKDLSDQAAVDQVFADHKIDRVIHLAAQAGVRHSLKFPRDYTRANVDATLNLLEACRHSETAHITFASTSSIYGANTNMPFSEHRGVDHPLQIYAATKRCTELMAHAYANLYQVPATALRFFTVYGPWGRPDMALFMFTRNIIAGESIPVFNNGNHTRDFTYVDDIAEGVVRSSDQIATPNPDWDSNNPDPATSFAPFRIFNIGNNSPVKLMEYIKAIEKAVGKEAKLDLLPLQPGDVPDTFADVTELQNAVGYRPATNVEVGVANFVNWYRDFYGE